MDTNKMREQFEAWVKAKWPDTYMERIPFGEGRTLEGNYWEVNVQMLWSSWQASRHAVLVELPDTEWFGDSWSGGWAIAREGVVDAIEAAGLKVAP